jgi:nucleotide-binding universal stress UspA family protein
MIDIKKILFPVDFSEKIDDLVPYAVTLTDKFGADLYVMTVTTDMSSFATFHVPHGNIQNFQNEVYRNAVKHIDALHNYFKDTPRMETLVVKGNPAEQIIVTAKKVGIDLIVMGTHSRKGLEKAIFGSVSEKVMQSGVCPVLSIPPKS